MAKERNPCDWEFAGWYPEHWEYTKALYGMKEKPEWYGGLEGAIENYDDKLKAEPVTWRKLDDPQISWEGYEHLIPIFGLRMMLQKHFNMRHFLGCLRRYAKLLMTL
jgi:hypothetical protein